MNNKAKAELLLSIRMKEEVLSHSISEGDRIIINSILSEINDTLGTNFSTHAELASLNIRGAGRIVAKYIFQLSSESIKMELLHLMVSDRIHNCGPILLQLYSYYKQTESCATTDPCKEEFYDNAFKNLRSKCIKDELLTLVCNPENAFALPLTLKMLASWRIPALKEQLIMYLDIQNSSMNASIRDYKNYAFICRELCFSALNCLKFYPTDEVIELLKHYATNNNPDIKECANHSLKYILKSI